MKLRPYEPGRSWSKGYVTRDGRSARILDDAVKSRYPIVAVLSTCNGNDEVVTLSSCGRLGSVGYDSPSDLMCAPEKSAVFVIQGRHKDTGELAYVVEKEDPRRAGGFTAFMGIKWTTISIKEVAMVEGEGLDP